MKDKLHSQVDSTGTTALAHMCSHNSPYIPLYLSSLKHGDPILNRATSLGHTPIDIAGMYCRKEYVEMLRAKGAEDNGRVDHWAIQGANYCNWSGEVDPTKTKLVAWAAFNNLPRVLEKFAEGGAKMDDLDDKGNAPIDIAVINKSYESVEVLAKLGYRPKETVMANCDSLAIKEIFSEINESHTSKQVKAWLKTIFVPTILVSQWMLGGIGSIQLTICLLLWLWLLLVPPKRDSPDRPTAFFSDIVNHEINYYSNHFIYLLLFICLTLANLTSLINLPINSFPLSIFYFVNIGVTLTFGVNLFILFYGIATNTTPSEMFQSHHPSHKYLWRKIDYVLVKRFMTRIYKNPHTKDTMENIKAYLTHQ